MVISEVGVAELDMLDCALVGVVRLGLGVVNPGRLAGVIDRTDVVVTAEFRVGLCSDVSSSLDISCDELVASHIIRAVFALTGQDVMSSTSFLYEKEDVTSSSCDGILFEGRGEVKSSQPALFCDLAVFTNLNAFNF